MGFESIAHEAEGQMGYWLRGHEGERNNCFSKIQLVDQKYRDKTTLASQTRFRCHCFGFPSQRFSLLVGFNILPISSSTNQNAALIIDHKLDFTRPLYCCEGMLVNQDKMAGNSKVCMGIQSPLIFS